MNRKKNTQEGTKSVQSFTKGRQDVMSQVIIRISVLEGIMNSIEIITFYKENCYIKMHQYNLSSQSQ